MLRANGVEVEIEGDDLIVHGTGPPRAAAAQSPTRMDHRIAMAFLVMGLASETAGRRRRCGLHRHQLPRLRGHDARPLEAGSFA